MGERINHALRKPARPSAAAGEPETIIEAVRTIVCELGKGATFTTAEIGPKIKERWPALADKVYTGLSTNLNFLIGKGEIKKDRPGRGAQYTVTGVKPPTGDGVTEKEAEWRKLRGEMDLKTTEE